MWPAFPGFCVPCPAIGKTSHKREALRNKTEAVSHRAARAGRALYGAAVIIGLIPGAVFAQVPVANAILPPPSGAPQFISASDDPLIRFLAETTEPQSFQEIVGRAAESHPVVLQAVAAREQVSQDRIEARAGLFPQISVNLSSDRSLLRSFRENEGNLVERSRPKSRMDAIISGEQLVFDFGATFHHIRSANARTKAAEAKARDLAASAALKGTAAYYDVLTNRLLTQLGREFVGRSKEILESVRYRFEQGYGPGGDVILVEGHIASAESQLAALERQLSEATARYLEAIRSEPAEQMSRPAPPIVGLSNYHEVVGSARHLPSVEAAEAQLEGSKQDEKAARAERFPRIAGVVDASKYDVFGPNKDYDVRGRIVVSHNLFGKAASSAPAQRARAQSKQAEFALQQAIDEAERDAGVAFRDVQALEAQLETLKRAYLASRRTRDLTVEQQRVARSSLIDLLRTERELFSAASNLVQGSSELDLARYVLLARTGKVLDYFHIGIGFDRGLSIAARAMPTQAIAMATISGKTPHRATAGAGGKQVSETGVAVSERPETSPQATSLNLMAAQPPHQAQSTAQTEPVGGITPLEKANLMEEAEPKEKYVEVNRLKSVERYLSKAAPTPKPSASLGVSASPRSAIPNAGLQKWAVQLGAFSTKSRAQDYWASLKKLPPLGGMRPEFVGERSLTKIRIAPKANRRDAEKLCTSISATGHDCLVVSYRSAHEQSGSN